MKIKNFLSFLLLIILFSNCKDSNKNLTQNEEQIIENHTQTEDLPEENKVSNLIKEDPCLIVAIEILTTSPSYLKQTKGKHEAVVNNGGTSYGIRVEGSPNPDTATGTEFSKMYEFAVHESYHDRIYTFARFKFDPTEKKLYEYEVVENLYHPIEFDKNLIQKFDKVCGK